MKLLTILGTRPEIIRLSRIIPKLDDQLGANHRVLHTGQNYDPTLNDIFFKDLGLRRPDVVINNTDASLGDQLGNMFKGVEEDLKKFRPDKVLILGDTNSSLSAILYERLGIPVYHMEAGNRCYDLKVPEEKNRRIIDSVSSFNLPYTRQSRENLLREGYPSDRIFVTGNPILEVMHHYRSQIQKSDILHELQVEPKKYVLVTSHREENVDIRYRLYNIFDALAEIAKEYPVIFSCHPRTKKTMKQFGIEIADKNQIKIVEPLGFFDFIKLEQECKLAITDSGTVQEEMCLHKIPTVTIRDTTERPETVWCGSNIVSGLNKNAILRCYKQALTIPTDWDAPSGYEQTNVSDTVVNILAR